MANFGFARLTVVAPYEAHWREARSAVGAPDLLKNARETRTLAEAVSSTKFVIGTGTVTARKPQQSVVSLPALAETIANQIRPGGSAALVFGPEKRGLTREDLSRCHLLVHIPTDARQPSMNLGQAVAVCLYELATHGHQAGNALGEKASPNSGGTSGAELERLTEVVGELMSAAHYSPQNMREANLHDVRLLLRRLNLNSLDAKRALGLFRRVLWRLKH